MALAALTLGHEARPFDYCMLCNYEMGAMGQRRRWKNCVLSFFVGARRQQVWRGRASLFGAFGTVLLKYEAVSVKCLLFL